MLKRLKHWFEQFAGGGPDEDERRLGLEREAQSLRLELVEREKILANLEATLERQRRDEERRIAEAVGLQIERLLSETATPLTQLLTQAHLLETAGKPLQAKDVLAVAKRLIRVLEQNGLTIEETLGETVLFDPNRHEPLSADLSIPVNGPVIVRFAGISCRGKMLRKARVDTAPPALD